VGLSQYGASRLAKTGRKHQQILAAYYPGTKVGKMY
jgi:SpoIID/LytB domain protein